ncbi:hypothetical protein V8E36_005723, partial [Tilletia maclaganii]
MTISAGETPQLAFSRTETPPRLLPNRRRGGGDRGREILNEESLADFGGGRFGSPEKRRRFQGSSVSPQNLRQTPRLASLSCHVVGLKKSHGPPALGFRHKIRGVKHCRTVMDGSKATLGDRGTVRELRSQSLWSFDPAEIGGGRSSFSIVRYRPGEGDCRWIFLLFLPRVSPAFGGREIRPLGKAAEMQRRRGGAWGTPQPSPPTSLL